MATQFPLREKRKAATRRSLIHSAQDLFAQRGYEQTTLEEVAENAGLHVQTLYRHFSCKMDLALAGDHERLKTFQKGIRSSQRRENTFVFWREWVRTAIARVTEEDGGQNYRELLQLRWGSPVISSQLLRIGHTYEDLLTESLGKDFGLPVDGISKPRMVAAMLWGLNNHVVRQHARQEGFDLLTEAVRVVDEVEALFGHLVVSQ